MDRESSRASFLPSSTSRFSRRSADRPAGPGREWEPVPPTGTGTGTGAGPVSSGGRRSSVRVVVSRGAGAGFGARTAWGAGASSAVGGSTRAVCCAGGSGGGAPAARRISLSRCIASQTASPASSQSGAERSRPVRVADPEAASGPTPSRAPPPGKGERLILQSLPRRAAATTRATTRSRSPGRGPTGRCGGTPSSATGPRRGCRWSGSGPGSPGS